MAGAKTDRVNKTLHRVQGKLPTMSASLTHSGLTDRGAHMLRVLQERLEQLYGERLHAVLLFGSYARGTANSESDMDVLVVLQGAVDAYEEVRRMSGPVYDLELEWEQAISILPVSRDRYEESPSPLFQSVRQEGIRA